MPVFDFFRNLFGGKDREDLRHERLDDLQSRTHRFRNPIWQNDDDENDDDDFRHFGNGIHFSIFTDPMEITRYFESQIDDILKSFFPGSDQDSFFSITGSGNVPEIPFTEPPSQDNLRDKMLKPGYDAPRSYDNMKSKTDADLDGKITPEDFTKIWEEPNNKQIVPSTSQFHHSSRFVTKRFVRGPDGVIEEQQIIRDSEGNEETRVSKQIGDKKYVITTKKDKNGIETKTEDLINMDESEIMNFEEKWKLPLDSNVNPNSILNYFPWEKFFEPNPKL